VGEVIKKDDEIRDFDQILGVSQEKYERVMLKLLTYRKEDILDLLQSLRNMGSVQNQKKKVDALQNELLKIDNELFELEKKYGEFKVRQTHEEVSKNDSGLLEVDDQPVASEDHKGMEESLHNSGHISPIRVKESSSNTDTPIKNETEEQVVRRPRAEVEDEILNLKNEKEKLESEIESVLE
jgi:hypothetical protein